jgi:hypothetical protein
MSVALSPPMPVVAAGRATTQTKQPDRRTAVLVGVLFLLSTVTFVTSNSVVTSVLGSHNSLTNVAAHSQVMLAAALIALIEGVATFGIAILLYPTLKQRHPALALGYAGMRLAETAIAAVFVLATFLLVTLSTSTTAAGASSEALATLLVALRHWTLMLIYLYTAVGGLALTYMLLRTKLIPSGLSVLGLVGYAALLITAILDMLGRVDAINGAGLIGLIPGGVFEFVLPIWLFVKGFNPMGGADRLPLGRNGATVASSELVGVRAAHAGEAMAVADGRLGDGVPRASV